MSQPTSRAYAIIEAPSTLGLRTDGVEQLPDRLREHGLGARIAARVAARLSPPTRDGVRDTQTRVLNAESIARWTPQLADVVGHVLDDGEFPIVLGGDCTILLGSTLALKRRGRYGLLFIDGQADFFQPDAEPHGEAASMDLAFVTGHGPNLLTNLEGRAPYIRAEDAVAFGFRDADDQREYGSQPLPAELCALDLPSVRRLGIERATHEALEHLSRPELDGFFVHVDADCLDDRVMPAVDFRLPDGLSWEELTTTLRLALASGAVGLEVTIYNPTLDQDGSSGRGLTDALVSALT